MSDHQQAPPIRPPDCDVPVLLSRPVWVRGRDAKEIAEHGSGLIEGHFVLAQILGCLLWIPLELHVTSVAGWNWGCGGQGLSQPPGEGIAFVPLSPVPGVGEGGRLFVAAHAELQARA